MACDSCRLKPVDQNLRRLETGPLPTFVQGLSFRQWSMTASACLAF